MSLDVHGNYMNTEWNQSSINQNTSQTSNNLEKILNTPILFQHKEITKNNITYNFLEAGDPSSTTKVFHLHGLVWSHNNFIPQLNDPSLQHVHHLAPNLYHTIYDPNRKNKEDYSFESLNDYLATFINELSQQSKIHLHWVSLWGEIAYRFASAHPNLVESIILSGASGFQEKMNSAGEASEIYKNKSNLERITDKVNTQFSDIAKVPQNLPQEVMDLMTDRMKFMRVVKFAGLTVNSEEWEKSNILETLKHQKIPVLLARWQDDKITPPEVIKTFAQQLELDKQNIHQLPAGHTPNIEVPELYNTIVAQRLSKFQHH